MYYLYVKTHNKTGMKYLGKTIKNPFVYKGSGKIWKRHIAKHGYDITTEILLESNDESEIANMGIHYSKLWNVVKSKDWANLRPENGDGGDTSKFINYEKRKSQKGEKNSFYGKTHSEEWKENHSKKMKGLLSREKNPFYGKTHSEETMNRIKEKISKKVTDGKRIFKSLTEAGEVYNRSRVTIRNWCNSKKDEWNFV